MAPWAPWALAAVFLFFLALFIPNAFPYWFRGCAPRRFSWGESLHFSMRSLLSRFHFC